MEFIHVKNLEKYHPGYRDRELKWAKIYFNIIQGDPEMEMLHEVDRSRYISFILLELQAKKPIPNDEIYFKRKGFDESIRPMSLTLQMLQNFIEVVTETAPTLWPREEKNKNKRREDIDTDPVTEPISKLIAYYNSTITTPRHLEREFIEELSSKFGFDKAKLIIRNLAENGFKKVKTMREALDGQGNIKPKPGASNGQRRKDYVSEQEYKDELGSMYE